MKKSKSRASRESAKRIIPRIVTVILILGFVFFLFFSVIRLLKGLDFFTIRDVLIQGNSAIDLSYLKGQNSFSVDLDREAQRIAYVYPTYKKIRLIRVLPGRIHVDFIKRQPLATVKLYKSFCVDDEGVFFDPSPDIQRDVLPVIAGLETKIFGAKPGVKFSQKELRLAINIIQEAQRNRAVRDYQIVRVDVANDTSAALFLKDPFKIAAPAVNQKVFLKPSELELLEVRIGFENIKDRISFLGSVLLQFKNDVDSITYIDLRFKEPVIKYKDVKKNIQLKR